MSNFLRDSIDETGLENSQKMKRDTHIINLNLLKQLNQHGKYRGNCTTIINDYPTAFKPMVSDTNSVTVNHFAIYPLHHTMSFIFPNEASNHKTSDHFSQEPLNAFSVNKINDSPDNNLFLHHKHERDINEYESTPPKKPTIFKHYSAPIKLTTIQLFSTKPTIEDIDNKMNRVKQDDQNNIYKCCHTDCFFTFKTKKQKLTHHIKMDNCCYVDAILLLKSISSLKSLLINSIFKKHPNISAKEISSKYDAIIGKVSIEDHAELITGLKFFKK